MVRLNSDESLAVGLDEQSDVSLTQMIVVPNPAVDHSHLQIQSKQSGMGTLQITNALGQVVSTENALVVNKGLTEIALPQGLSAGIYHVSFETNGQILTTSFVK